MKIPPRAARPPRPTEHKFRVVYTIWRQSCETSARVDGLLFDSQEEVDARVAADSSLIFNSLSSASHHLQLETESGRLIVELADVSMIDVSSVKVGVFR